MCNCNCNCCNNNFGNINNIGNPLCDLGFESVGFGGGGGLELPSDIDKRRIKALAKEQERLGGPDKVIVGETIGRRINYKTNTIHITVKQFIAEQGDDYEDEGFDGYTLHEGFIRINDPAAFYTALQEIGYSGSYVAIDKQTGELIESFYRTGWQF